MSTLMYCALMLGFYQLGTYSTDIKYNNYQIQYDHEQKLHRLESGLVKAEYCTNEQANHRKSDFCKNALAELNVYLKDYAASTYTVNKGESIDYEYVIATYKLKITDLKYNKPKLKKDEYTGFIGDKAANLLAVAFNYAPVFMAIMAYFIACTLIAGGYITNRLTADWLPVQPESSQDESEAGDNGQSQADSESQITTAEQTEEATESIQDQSQQSQIPPTQTQS
ncbi:hypothetical protein L1D14_03820 [Vibrio tubiashii]|uniref:hypothetical protein n=1 Tax=Vibrio tubiashii TaxID=29498 RepID=UPI001EFCF8AD|nr:hypothetical protein [Vibrio tubiashii]MCG9575358.1 hypothetical protein [Vibrio tubiashii]